MTSDETRRRAAARGVATSYRDWHGRQVEVSQRTLDAILDALGEPPDTPGARRGRCPRGPWLKNRWSKTPWLKNPVVPGPEDRSWGFAVQLYSLRSRQSWGHGDLGDLADLAAWSASDLGAGFILINPLHAGEPLPPLSQSPYLPMSRRFTSPLYLRIEDIPEYAKLTAGDRVRIDSLAAPLRARNATSELLNRDEVWQAKRSALQIIYRQPMTAQRRAEFDDYRRREGQSLQDWGLWCALAEIHGPDWRAWPEPLRAVGSAEVAAERDRLAGQALFHAWLQWLADGQLAAAQEAARAAGMRIGIIRDLAVGCHPGGADAWAWQDVLVTGVSVGAPPDEFNQRGQDWNQPPWHPQRLAAQQYAPLADLMHAALQHAGGLRVDHVMGLFRLWWVPAGMGPDQGTYVRYDHRAMVGVLAGQAVVGRGAGHRRGSRHRGAVDPGVPGRAGRARHGDAVVRARPGRGPAPAGQVAAQLPGHGGHARRPADRGVRDRGAGGAAFPARPADPLLPGRK